MKSKKTVEYVPWTQAVKSLLENSGLVVAMVSGLALGGVALWCLVQLPNVIVFFTRW